MNRKRVLNSLVQVRHAPRCWGTGFLIGGHFIVTAAHCLPRLTGWPEDPACVRVRAHKDGPARGQDAIAQVVFVDPCCDVAVLTGPDDQAAAAWHNQFTKLASELQSLPVRGGNIQDALQDGHKLGPRAHVYRSRGGWISGNATRYGHSIVFSHGVTDGTSGAPIVDAMKIHRERIGSHAITSSDELLN